MNFDEVKRYASDVISGYSNRDKMFREMEKIYLLEDMGDLPDNDWIKPTRHPDARNALVGAVRLLTAADPKISIAEEYNQDYKTEQASKIERLGNVLWRAAGRIRGKPVHYDAVLSGLLYSEVQIAVKSTVQMLQSNPKNRRLQELAKRTPIIFDVINPTAGYPVMDEMGLKAYVSAQMRRVGDMRDILKLENIEGRKDTDDIKVYEYWDFDQHVVWVEGQERPAIDEENPWGYIPVICQVCEGSELFSASQFGRDVYQTRQPFLYTLWKSNLVFRQNLSLTLQSSLAFAIGANPLFLYKRNRPDKTAPDMDFSQPGGRVTIDADEDYQPLAKQVLDPSLMQMNEMYDKLSADSTIYRQTLGEPLGANAPFSMVALLSQSGRLPLVPYQRTISWAIGDALKCAFKILKTVGESGRVVTDDGYIDYDVNDIPDEFEVSVQLDIDLPQDERVNAMIALQLTQGENPLASLEYARSKFLGIEQPDMEQYRVWSERAAQMRFMQMLQEEMMQAQQQQQMAQQMMQGGMPPGGMPPAGMEQMPPQQPPGEMPPMPPGANGGEAQMGLQGFPLQEPVKPLFERGLPGEEEL
jgi:hypothetical protein